MLYSKTYNKDLPGGSVYHGSGEVSEADRACKFFQNGLYYNADGKLLEGHPHNVDRIRRLEAFQEKPSELPPPEKRAGNPETLATLSSMDDADLRTTAERLLDKLDEEGVKDDFVPGDDRRANEDFILKYV